MQTNEILIHLSNKELEVEVLSSVFIDSKIIKQITIKEEVLFDKMHQYILYLMKKIDEMGLIIDAPTIISEGTEERKVDIGRLYEAVTYLASNALTAPNMAYKQKKLVELYMKREQVKLASDVLKNVLNVSSGDLNTKIKERLGLIEESLTSDDNGHISDVMKKVVEDLEVDRGLTEGSPTHMRDLDKLMNGMRKQEVIIIGANPSVGKTVLAMNMAENHATNNNGISVVFSIEMSDLSIGKRLLSSHSNIHSDKIRNPIKKFDDKDWIRTMDSVGRLSNTKMHIIDQSNVNTNFIRNKCLAIKEIYKDSNEHMVVFIDYLGLIKGSSKYSGNKRLEIGEITIQLKALSKELDCTIVLLSQLSRDSEKDKRKPQLSDLKESGDVEAVADVVILLYREDYQGRETEKKNIIELIVAKNRNGSVGSAEMTFLKHLSKFVDIG